MKSNKNTTIYVGMSGGVDSSVAAALLVEQGYHVVGVYMKNWSGDDFGIQAECPWEEEVKDVQKVCDVLGIEFKSFNFEREYRREVVEYFFNEYRSGRTPNPDIMCNRQIKFGRFLDKAVTQGADYIATGHYAQVKNDDGKWHLIKGVDSHKDQSYFLHTFTQEQLKHVLFPIGHLKKENVRTLARSFNLPNAHKPDSQGICFIGEINVHAFLRAQLPQKQGNIIDFDSGEVVGTHDGAWFFTIGQREGLGVGGTKEPYYVQGKDIEKNELYVCMGKANPLLFKRRVTLKDMSWISESTPDYIHHDIQVAIRYNQIPQPGSLHITDTATSVDFESPQQAVAPGQSAVVYQGDECLGGGVIES